MTRHLRESGVIEDVFSGKEDHGILTISVGIKVGCGHQGFGQLALDEKTHADFAACLIETFGVGRLDELNGRACVCLRCFDDWGATIEGLESTDTGKRFVLTEWRRRHCGPDLVKDPLESRVASLKGRIASLKRSLADAQDELATVRGEYHPIGAAP